MSIVTLRRYRDRRPPSFLVDAAVALLEHDPDRPVELRPDVFVRAVVVVDALAPELLDGPASIGSQVVDRVRAYTEH